MPLKSLNILLADDDKDDCFLFQEALDEIPITSTLNFVHNGEQLIQLLNNPSVILPDLLFMDLNMPRKNGLECLTEIKSSSKLKNLPVIIYSTSYEQNIAKWLHENGAQYYFRKPSDFQLLKKDINKALSLITENNFIQPSIERFLIQSSV